MSAELQQAARAIFAEAIGRVDVQAAVRARIHCDGQTLTLGDAAVLPAELDRVAVVSVGKAAVPMYRAAEEALRPSGLRLDAIVVGGERPVEQLATGVFLCGAHPTPDRSSRQAAESVLNLLSGVTPRTVVLFLLSGGASAMLELPLDPAITLEEIAGFHRALVGSGMQIARMNALRKHFSAVKGGRLAVAAAAARVQATLLVSDVPPAALDTIGSGPSLPDSSTLDDCRRLLAQVRTALPERVADFFAGPLCVETPKAGDPAFARAHWTAVLSSEHLAQAAAEAARAAGFDVEIDNACDEWEYREAGRYLLGRGAALAREHGRSCLVSVGEAGVALEGESGEGGRNQQLALWCAAELARRGQRATVLSAGSDGIDGHSAAAGAVCDEESVARASALGLDAAAALARFDAGPLLRAIGDDLVTGPTGNNLRDLRLVLSA